MAMPPLTVTSSPKAKQKRLLEPPTLMLPLPLLPMVVPVPSVMFPTMEEPPMLMLPQTLELGPRSIV